MMAIALIAAAAYLIGSIPAGYLAARLAGIDIRKVGSGNVGATNVTRTLGKKFGYPVFAFDFLKGFFAVHLAKVVMASLSYVEWSELGCVIAAVLAVIGHTNPVWLGFKGGKGVATSLGALFALNWLGALIVGLVWIITFMSTRYVSLASIVAAIALPVTIGTMLLFKRLSSPVLFYFSLCLAGIVLFRHRSNISRLSQGTETRFLRK
jgi:acyl phosphate:glycerol-3-phosphate acyltransferase